MLTREQARQAIIDYMEDNDLNQSEMGELLGVKGAAICRWVNGTRNIGYNTTLKLMELLTKQDGEQ